MISVFLVSDEAETAKLRAGRIPTEFSMRQFSTPGELAAYKNGVTTVASDFDECDELWATSVNGCEVVYSYCHPHNDETPDDVRKTFSTPAEAQAFLTGLQDADGTFGATAIDCADNRYDALSAVFNKTYPDWLTQLVSSSTA